MKDEFDERQVLIRGKIAVQTVILTLIILLTAAFINDFHIFDFEHEVGFSSFMIGASCLILAFISSSLILRDAYFGLMSMARSSICRFVFTALGLVEIILLGYDLMNGEGISFVSACCVIMVVTITSSLWYKRKG